MDNAQVTAHGKRWRDRGNQRRRTAAPGGPRVTDTDGIPEETDGDGDGELKEGRLEEGELKSQDIADLTAVEREDSLLPCSQKTENRYQREEREEAESG